MKNLALIIFIFCSNTFALEYSKIEYEGCPENAYCKKETGLTRKKWIEDLRSYKNGKISEQKINANLKNEYGLPISAWAQENGSLSPNILMWDSPCKQHQNANNKFYIAEIFKKNLKPEEIKDSNSIYFSRAVLLDQNNKPYSYIIPRGDAPLFIKDSQLYFLREEEGIFYGLLISRDGQLKLVKNESSPEAPKEAVCSKEQVALFLREAPSPNFYQGQFCKDIWDVTLKTYRRVLLGWSCN